MDVIVRILDTLPGLSASVLTSFGGLILVVALRFVALRVANRNLKDPRVLYRWRKGIGYTSFVLGIVLVGGPWLPSLQGIATVIGIVAAGLAVALKDPIVNLAGWVFLMWRRPFEVGDRIQVGVHSGDVIDVRIFQFTLMEIGNWVNADQSTGRVIHVPNGKLFTEATANYSKGFQYIWDEIPVLITFESNWERAKGILLELAGHHGKELSGAAEERLRQAAQKYMIFYSKLTPTVYTSVQDSGVLLTVRYLCEPRRRRGSQQAVWEDILRKFAQCDDIDFAYPTQRFYNNTIEDKAHTKPARNPGDDLRPDSASA